MENLQPIVKWVGGKRQLMNEIKERIPKEFGTYYEPFIGGGAVLFELQPKKAVINDFNKELVNLYKVIKKNVESLIEDLKKHENEETYFYALRNRDREDDYGKMSEVEKASRFIYLNKTCFNGLYRVNSKGYFNTPYGNYKNPNIVNEEGLRKISNYFNENKVEIKNGDFEDALKDVESDSFVYLDPPYDPVTKTASFTGYTSKGFGKEEQVRLKELCDELNKKGTKFMVSNAKTEFIVELYKDYKIETVMARRNINSKGTKRGAVEEVLIMNY